ncbi:MAG: MMPL family transporter [Pseudomonadales bacterium]|nr:MMPL family transporter [Pseudomonadales bacterium]
MATIDTLSHALFSRVVAAPKLILTLICLLTLAVALQVSSINFDASSEKLLKQSNPTFKTYLQFKKDYQAGLGIILLIEDKNIFSSDFLQRLESLQEDLLDNVPYINEVESLLTSRRVLGDSHNLYFDSLIPDRHDKKGIEEAKTIALTTPYYQNHIINATGDATALIIKLQPFIYSIKTGESRQLLQKEMHEVIAAIEAVVARHEQLFTGQLSMGGPTVATIEMVKASKHDVAVFSFLALLVIAIALALVFRRASAVLLPLFLLSLSITITLSWMLIAEVPIQNVSAILPSFLLAVCVCDSVHFLQAFYRRFDAGMAKKEAILSACQHTQTALFFTTITTAAGLISFTTSSLTPIANFGLFAAIGVIIALIFTYLCLPALLMLFPIKAKTVATKHSNNEHAAKLARWIQKNAKIIVLLSITALGLSAYGISQLKLSHDTLSWFPEDNKARLSVERIDEKLTGTMPLELLIDSGSDYGIYNPVFMQQLDSWLTQLQQEELAGIKIRTAASLLDLIKEVNAILAEDKAFQVPATRSLIAQEILLIEMDSADLVSILTDVNYRTLRITLATSWQDAVYYRDFIQALENSFAAQFNAPITLTMTGMMALSSQIITEMMNGMVSSYLLAAIMVTLLMVILLRSIKLGAIMMLPNLLPIAMILGFMQVTDTPLDMFTLLIGAIAIGIIVDDSIHFIHGFQRAFKKSGSALKAVEQTFNDEGRALLITTVILCCGFLVYLFSALHNLQRFGLLTALCIVLALIADFILAPAIIFLIYKDNAQKS